MRMMFKTYVDMRKDVIHFMNDKDISAYDLVRIAKDLCACRRCKFFEQHYSKSGKELDFGHCCKNSNPSPRKLNVTGCGFWTLEGEVEEID